MPKVKEADLRLGWAATLLLYASDVGSHLKEFESVFPGLGGKLSVEADQRCLLPGEGRDLLALVLPTHQPVQAYPVARGYADEGFQTRRVLAVLDIGDV